MKVGDKSVNRDSIALHSEGKFPEVREKETEDKGKKNAVVKK